MRFLLASLFSMAMINQIDAKRYQFDVTGDNTFQVYVSYASDPSNSEILKSDTDQPSQDGKGEERQYGWSTPARYTGIELNDGDVISVYVHNEDAASNPINTIADGNPSAIVGRLREIDSDGKIIEDGTGADIPTDEKWECAYRIEEDSTTDDDSKISNINFNPARFTGSADNWAAANFNTATEWNNLGANKQRGSVKFLPAIKVQPLFTTPETVNIWDTTQITVVGTDSPFGTIGIKDGITSLEGSTPYWIYGTDQEKDDQLVHHGWCRYKFIKPGNLIPGGGEGDPVFSGFQGQEFQFHGLPDEHFNLVSTPTSQLNAHFVYLSAGKCDYNNTVCWTHPGTYMDVLGFTVGETHVRVVAGTHEAGLRVWLNDAEVPRHTTVRSLATNVTGSLHHAHDGFVTITTDLIDYEITNSDNFMNFRAALKSSELLKVGGSKHTVTDTKICHTNTETHNHQLIEHTVAKKYPITTPLHGLVGQTWRNVKVCGRDWMGTVEDYVVDSLFGTSYHYNNFKF